MKKMFNKKLVVLFLSLFVSASLSYADNFGIDLLKNSSLSINCPFSITTGDIFKFAKANTGVEISIDTNLYGNKEDFISLGIFTTYNFNSCLFTREEISSFYTHSLIEGMWIKFLLPQDFVLKADIGIGLAFTKVSAKDIRGTVINDYFNSFVIGTTVVVTRQLFSFGPCAVLWDAGIETRIYIEKQSCFQSFGIVAGFIIKAR